MPGKIDGRKKCKCTGEFLKGIQIFGIVFSAITLVLLQEEFKSIKLNVNTTSEEKIFQQKGNGGSLVTRSRLFSMKNQNNKF